MVHFHGCIVCYHYCVALYFVAFERIKNELKKKKLKRPSEWQWGNYTTIQDLIFERIFLFFFLKKNVNLNDHHEDEDGKYTKIEDVARYCSIDMEFVISIAVRLTCLARLT